MGDTTERAFSYDGASLAQSGESDGEGGALSSFTLTPDDTHLAQVSGGDITS